ncbi:vesicle transporter [Capsaspora owczarzaki ATCC 30864]|uniref:Vesicle transporter n=1 Tax=Capsaspora owczarzaki (strain ATCC 30864) TaxID=595528 RepID=A0A0D2VXD6_CAPO3|nr:vesicle transporter [Capsaspora owczarzaki ATCC 30864]KJE96312.1 vesicle transporter [Capsaspora owczarzaki ATCC 30864]|eukprot:XP_004344275.1 vesicle transporter [Capsaspora owczarzaki ATCC 30864]
MSGFNSPGLSHGSGSGSSNSITSTAATSAGAGGLRERQIDGLRAMLNATSSSSSVTQLGSSASAPDAAMWKVLVYDRAGQDIISPLMKISELRDLGVTLHLLLHSDREPIPDVAAVYFVMPTKENIERIAKDCRDGLYDTFYINFISSLSRNLLEELASLTVQNNSSNRISKLFDQHMSFISLEQEMFVLRPQDKERTSYYAINNPEAKDADIEGAVDDIVDNLFGVLVTMSTIPVIRCQRGHAAEMVGERLDTRLRDHLKSKRANLFAEGAAAGASALQRPVLILLDRNIDLATMVQHTWQYQPLVHDLLDFKLNRVTIGPSAASGQASRAKTYDLDQIDSFWTNNRANPFPTVAMEVENALNAYKAQADDISKLSSALGLGTDGASAEDSLAALQGALAHAGNQSLDASSTQRLTMAVSSLPEMLEKKRLIDLHTTVATALLENIKARQIDTFVDLEERILSKSSLERPLLDVLKDPAVGTAEDKLRLFLIFYLSSTDLRDAEIADYERALQEAGADLSAVASIKRLRAFNRMSTMQQSNSSAGGVLSRMTFKDFNKVLEHGSELFKQGVKNLLPTKQTLPVTRIVESIMEAKSGADEFRFFDPKASSAAMAGQLATAKSKATFQEAVVFVVGGGSFVELQNLQEYAKKQVPMPRRITYGATELLNAKQFLAQLDALGKKG